MSVITTHLTCSGDGDARLARRFSCLRAFVLLHAVAALLAPASVWGDIYKWTDERGNMVVSNVRPVDPAAVRDVVVLAKETKPAARAAPAQAPSSPASAPAAQEPAIPSPTEQALQERIENLEREIQTQQYALQAQQYALQAQAASQASYAGAYQPTPAPPVAAYASDSLYYNPWPPAYSPVVIPVPVFVTAFAHRPVGRLLHRPGFIHRPGFAPKPAFAIRPAVGFSPGGSARGAWVRRGTR